MKKIALVSLLLVVMLAICCVASAEVKTFTYESRGVQVPATLVTPDGVDSYPVVIMAHGHGGSREENVGFAALADAMAAKGIASIRMDFSGCGESTESFQLNCLTNMEDDVQEAINYAFENLPMTHLGLFGYSMGGRIVLELTAMGQNPDAIVLLAPAADNTDLKNLFGGPEAWEQMKAKADADGYVVFTTMYGQVQELSAQWFADFNNFEDCKVSAAQVYDGPALVIYAEDDEAVNPEVSKAVATSLKAEINVISGEGHGYGFYSETDGVRNGVADAVATFFAKNLK